jgi:hypothetical protein
MYVYVYVCMYVCYVCMYVCRKVSYLPTYIHAYITCINIHYMHDTYTYGMCMYHTVY